MTDRIAELDAQLEQAYPRMPVEQRAYVVLKLVEPMVDQIKAEARAQERREINDWITARSRNEGIEVTGAITSLEGRINVLVTLTASKARRAALEEGRLACTLLLCDREPHSGAWDEQKKLIHDELRALGRLVAEDSPRQSEPKTWRAIVEDGIDRA